jgi:molybdate transport system regulatory protein
MGPGKLGPGKVTLLELIEEKGSIRAAAAAMDMSYRRAWLLIRELETIFGAPVLDRATGGRHGGGAKPNALGKAIMTRYRAMERDAAVALGKNLKALEKLAGRN